MDLVSSCKDKLAYFRIKELKDVLTQLGLPKQGKKQDLVDKILSVISDDQVSKAYWAKRNPVGKDEVAKIIDDVYRKMQIPGATDLASKGHSGSDVNNVKLKVEIDDSFQLEQKIRCPCGSSLATESMIQCEDSRCHVWQHISCVIIPEKPMEGVPPVPPQFYCEICRISRADPFWLTLAHPLLPVKLTTSNIPADGTNPVQNVERTFQLARADRDLLLKPEYDVQAWCILLNDKVSFRMQWPQYADLQINGVPVRTTNRPVTQSLGANGRDDGPAITTCTREGINKVSLSGCDARIFCLGVRIVRRRTMQQVMNLIPKEQVGEQFEDSVARVRRCIGGGTATDNADSDSDLEVVADSITVNLRCPMSGSRMKVAGRFKPCAHMGCFDLNTFVELNQRSRKWQCPICLKNYSLENLIIDPYFNRIATMMQDCGEDVNEIDVRPDGSWRVKNENERRDLAQWHLPDGSLYVTEGDMKPLEISKQIKQEGVSEGHTGLKLGIRKNSNGHWEVSKPEEIRALSSGNQLPDKLENHGPKIMPMSSSATGSCRDGDDPSVNQEGGGHFDFSTTNDNELDSLSLNFESTFGVPNRIPSAVNADVIVLSDSEEENENLISNDTTYDPVQVDPSEICFTVPPPGVPDSYHDPAIAAGGSSCLGLFNGNVDDFGMPLWPLPSGTQAGSSFQLFGTDTDVSETLVDVQRTSVTCPTPMNGYVLPPETAVGTAAHVSAALVGRPDPVINDGLVDNPLAFGGDDPSLQIFLPTCPAGISAQSNLRDQSDMSNGIRGTEDWISLRLGGSSGGGTAGGGGTHGNSESTNGLNSRDKFSSKERRLESLADTASLLLSMNDNRSDKRTIDRQKSDSPFSFPRQPRSVRPRLDLCIDLDSE
ncbi:E3 SUMO-protein ligase SIZ1-like isoform X2 [Macadamia integrifolia]|uniref:E3 SUMO-protein ligase SIZ1-like isoform X2 n=1 Tax=Macadamia integrifolia TaxID=60698 RepID=UPI001C4FD114|nr:E3 SUMO-protein ligase SIZ1-like isoform X2 [Macadamia integrifolia]